MNSFNADYRSKEPVSEFARSVLSSTRIDRIHEARRQCVPETSVSYSLGVLCVGRCARCKDTAVARFIERCRLSLCLLHCSRVVSAERCFPIGEFSDTTGGNRTERRGVQLSCEQLLQ